MPYIDQEARKHISVGGPARTPGELNYVIARECIRFLRNVEGPKRAISYQNLNDVLGALEGAKQEFYRRVVVPYEEKKLAENGDVFVLDIARMKAVE